MKSKNFKLLLTLIVITLFSCSNDDLIINDNLKNEQEDRLISKKILRYL